ncbi:MAG: hypothetical protein IJU91_00595, partial [Selenomonadaceae bacterium]|nr:hypothetical protein [Selenomonadaceae bacterium]
KNIEKIAAEASRKAQGLVDKDQHFATKIDTEKLSERLQVLEDEQDGKGISELESKLSALQKRSDNLQKSVQTIQGKNYDETITSLIADVKNIADHFNSMVEGLKTFDDNLQILDTGIKNLDAKFNNLDEELKSVEGQVENVENEVHNVESQVQTVENRVQTVEERPAPAESEPIADERLTAIEDEHKDFTQKLTDYNNVLQKHHVALVQWKSNFIVIQNTFNAIQAKFDENKQTLENLQTRLDEQQKFLDDYKTQTESISGVKTEFDGIKSAVDDFKSEFDGVKADVDSVKADVDAVKSDVDEVKSQIAQVQNADGVTADIGGVKSDIDGVKTAVDDFKSEFDGVKNEFDGVKTDVSEVKAQLETQVQSIGEFKSQLDTQEKILGDVKTQFDAQGSLLDSVQKSISALEKILDSMKEPTFLTIENFDLKPTGRIFFTDKPDEVFQNLKIASNLSGITSFLATSKFAKKENFIRIIENYRQNLKKVTDKVRRKKFNEDALSEEVTDAFFNTLSKFFLATIPISIYRGARQETLDAEDEKMREEEFKFYSEFLKRVNDYLASCHVYTVPVLPKNPMTSNDIDRMSVTRKETANAEEDNLIDEVERLPYFMDYLTEGGETENFCSEGKMVVLKYDGEAQ